MQDMQPALRSPVQQLRAAGDDGSLDLVQLAVSRTADQVNDDESRQGKAEHRGDHQQLVGERYVVVDQGRRRDPAAKGRPRKERQRNGNAADERDDDRRQREGTSRRRNEHQAQRSEDRQRQEHDYGVNDERMGR